ncbi:MAG: hypothetical protein KDB03_22555 [Planctomycetales bacterium]|nr:hypothetical protein [Planctomycetales bacterium]
MIRFSAGGYLQISIHALISWAILVAHVANVRAQADIESRLEGEHSAAWDIGLGLAGFWKLGHITSIQFNIPKELQDSTATVGVESIDGDGVGIIYRQAVMDAAQRVRIPIRIGRQSTLLKIALLDSQSHVLRQIEIDSMSVARSLPSTQPFALCVGSGMGLQQLVRVSADGETSSFTNAVVKEASELPTTWSEYTSCELVVLSTANMDLIQDVSPAQWEALNTWVRRGGICVISIAPNAKDELNGVAALKALLPGELKESGRVINPGSLESFVATDDPLDVFDLTHLELNRGQTVLSLPDSFNRSTPWWVRYSHGLGVIQCIGSDLDATAFASWDDRQLLWERIITPYLDRNQADGKNIEVQVGESSYLGYDDMVGQLRATLDVFPGVEVLSFGKISAILVCILLLVGPFDYWLSVKRLGRPHLSWYFSGIALTGISFALVAYYYAIRPDEVHVNSVQVMDIDLKSGDVSGNLWSHVYSAAARKVDLEAILNSQQRPISLDWQGLPGRGLGGLLSQLNTDRGMPSYVSELGPDGSSRLSQVGISAAGTKCVYATWRDFMDPMQLPDLREIPGVDQLEGELVNPLDVELEEAMLFYHNWFYSLPSRILPKQTVPVSFDTIPKDLPRRLNGRRTLGTSEASIQWNPGARDQLDRLLEIMMFYHAASGRSYTKLANRFQPQVDRSHLIALDRAVLVAKISRPPVQLKVTGTAEDLKVIQDIDRVWCRLSFPVQQNKQD